MALLFHTFAEIVLENDILEKAIPWVNFQQLFKAVQMT
jgi:hypothetical protein